MTEPVAPKWSWKSFILEHIKSIPGDLRGLAVGALLTGLAVYLWPDQVQSTYAIPVNADGYATPLAGLLRNAARENPSTTYRTDPEDLAKAWVCEAASISGDGAHQLLVQYVDLYKDCFSLDEKSKTEIAVRPNRQSGVMRHDARGWFCKCNNSNQSQPK
ncbi:hypothetical protein [Mesorhizobium sp.]|uniref:hypothetical protein n=1 Tax=Mesorhizobium sp. TaxID=1871066 RepID=UPI000FEA5787|nr:hypothetical protein [Mesorhizobium sp.]RWB69704.1 MAG: hypothetical protein EOQ49_19695 [Mesorhizobium sp.]